MHWRKSTWTLILWTGLMVVWLVSSVSATARGCADSGGHSDDCTAYVGLVGAIILFVGLAGALLLAAVWFATRGTIRRGEGRWGDPTPLTPEQDHRDRQRVSNAPRGPGPGSADSGSAGLRDRDLRQS